MLQFAKDHVDKLLNKRLMKKKKTMLSLLKEKHDVERKEEAAFKHMNLILFAKHGGGYVMAWGSFSASGLERLLLLKISMNFQLNQQILEEKKQSEKSSSTKEWWEK